MDVNLPAGRYVAAISGGVDSVVLLHMLKDVPGVKLTVAHYDHGIRPDSAEDRKLVQELAATYGLPFVYHTGQLGPTASEAQAREVRYKFLHHVRQASGADAVITAHHQDDMLETAVLNLLRGTGRRGLSALKSTNTVQRPLLHVPKKELLRYATEQGLNWREDSTNSDTKYLRNHVRHHILSRFAEADREVLLNMVRQATELNKLIECEVVNYLHVQPSLDALDRQGFIMLPHIVAREVMAQWLSEQAEAELTRRMLERLVVAAKTGRTGSRVDVNKRYWLQLGRERVVLRPKLRIDEV
jgi:tRNA(Ile)-lysidine synthase